MTDTSAEVGRPPSPGGPSGVVVTPEPTEEELAAILAAYAELWPKPDPGVGPDGTPRWRFAGRWWAKRPRYGGWT